MTSPRTIPAPAMKATVFSGHESNMASKTRALMALTTQLFLCAASVFAAETAAVSGQPMPIAIS